MLKLLVCVSFIKYNEITELNIVFNFKISQIQFIFYLEYSTVIMEKKTCTHKKS